MNLVKGKFTLLMVEGVLHYTAQVLESRKNKRRWFETFTFNATQILCCISEKQDKVFQSIASYSCMILIITVHIVNGRVGSPQYGTGTRIKQE